LSRRGKGSGGGRGGGGGREKKGRPILLPIKGREGWKEKKEKSVFHKKG